MTTEQKHKIITDLQHLAKPIETLHELPNNPRRGDIQAVTTSYARFGQRKPIVALEDGTVIAGNHQLAAAKQLGWTHIAVATVKDDDATAKAYALADNRTADLGEYDEQNLLTLLTEVAQHDADLILATGYEEEDIKEIRNSLYPPQTPQKISMSDQFLIPPFTILDQRSGQWQDRKRQWLAYGINSGEGREEGLTYLSKNATGEFADKIRKLGPTTSVFDPVLCEIAYRWFSPQGGTVLDPFSGGSVRGITAATLGRNYTGIDLRPEQVEANRKQWETISNTPALPEPEQTTDDPNALTPIQEHGGHKIKRDDLFAIGGSRGGKVRTCLAIATEAARNGAPGLITAGSRQSPQVNIVATVASKLGLACRAHTPEGPTTPEIEAAKHTGAEIIQHKAGYNNVIIARAKEDATNTGWAEIPFGMETPLAVKATAAQVANIPANTKRIVVPVGSGMTLAGIITGLEQNNLNTKVLGIQVGADPTKRLNTYAPNWRDRTTLIKSDLDYHKHAPTTTIGNLELDPVYEAKCLPHLAPGDLLWIVGRRETADTTTHISAANTTTAPVWHAGDSNTTLKTITPPKNGYDLLFSCPPYADLEKYSTDPNDLSNMPYEQFLETYNNIIKQSVDQLADNSFAVWVVGEIRDKKGYYRGFVADTIQAFKNAGMHLYNEAILVSPSGGTALRCGQPFKKTRKLGKNHQNVLVFWKEEKPPHPTTRALEEQHDNVLVFVKGDPKTATNNCGPVQIDDALDTQILTTETQT